MADIETLTGDGNGNEYTVRGNNGVWVHWAGTWDGATLKLQFLDHGGSWGDIAGGSDTSNTDDIYDLPHGTVIRTNAASTGGSTSVKVDYRSVTLRL